MVARKILQELGFETLEAADGQEALNLLKKKPFDLVFMDVQMPVMDGLTATQKIRDPKSDVLNHKIPIIAMTANAMKGDKEMCFDAGMNDYVAKPVDPKEISEKIEKWVKYKNESKKKRKKYL